MYCHGQVNVATCQGRPSFHDMTDQLDKFVKENDITNGILVITSPHTTCSLFFDEDMHDRNFYGDDLLHVDISEKMEEIVPRMTTEGQYHSPGPKHIEFGLSLTDPNYPAEKWVMLNTDAHLKSSLYGTPSITVIIKDQQLLLGSLGRVFFVDWDTLRKRERTVNLLLLGE